jgi:hypothetical protein
MQHQDEPSPHPGRAGNRLRRAGIAMLLAATAFALSGCETLMVATGQRVRLDGIPLQSIAASLNGATALAPGGKAPLSIIATTTDGRTLATAGTGDGKVLADSYTFEASVAAVSAKGVVSLPDDPRLVEGRTPHVRITAAGTTAPVAELDIPVRYDVPFAATYAGASGTDGTDGLDGQAGSDGSAGSSDPDSPSAGGDGGDGTDGDDGGDGADGGPAPDVRLWIALEPGAHPLLRVRASEAGHDHFFLVDPQGGSLTIAVRGGAGGSGGSGGAGGQGGSGGSGEPDGSAGSAGQDGRDGESGNGGAAGQVTLTVDPAAAPYLDRVHITNVDGNGHAGSAPAVTIAPVASPW